MRCFACTVCAVLWLGVCSCSYSARMDSPYTDYIRHRERVLHYVVVDEFPEVTSSMLGRPLTDVFAIIGLAHTQAGITLDSEFEGTWRFCVRDRGSQIGWSFMTITVVGMDESGPEELNFGNIIVRYISVDLSIPKEAKGKTTIPVTVDPLDECGDASLDEDGDASLDEVEGF